MTKILIAEDEYLVRALIADLLQDHGYHVIEAQNGEEALRLLVSIDDIALLISDVRMPKIDGYELARAARRLRPEVGLLFTTGYSGSAPPPELAEIRTLHKPFDLDVLKGIVESLIPTASRGS